MRAPAPGCLWYRVPTATIRRVSVDHYENFPVASWLCPPALRPAIVAIYRFARLADDIADEGNVPAAQRLARLQDLRTRLAACHAAQDPPHEDPDGIFRPLQAAIHRHRLPLKPMDDLLDAFMQDVRKTRDGQGYADRAELLDYCRRSANPVGRLLLHLYRLDDARSLARSDAICTALQLINFWQDAGVDLARGRCYLPVADCLAHGLSPGQLQTGQDSAQSAALLRVLTDWACGLMMEGAPLVFDVPGRAGWELRLVVQGGLRIARRIEALGWRTLSKRPVLRSADLAIMAWDAIRMRRTS